MIIITLSLYSIMLHVHMHLRTYIISASAVKVLEVLVCVLAVLVVELDEQLVDSNRPEDHLRVAHHILLVRAC